MASQLPGARAAIADNQGLPTPEFYRFLLGLQRLSAGSATSADIAALQTQITAIQSEIDGLPKSSFPTLQVAAPVYSQGLLQNGFARIGVNVANSVIVNGTALQLDGDTAAPGNTYLYSTGIAGTKGWNALSSMLHQSANVAVTFAADGTATFDLAPLTDSGAGTFKLITRDTYGRLAGTKAGTTSDVPEGTNLYFTAARVLATVLAGLSTATNAVITATDTVLSALGKLQAQISANAASLTGKLASASNLSDVANAATARTNLGLGTSATVNTGNNGSGVIPILTANAGQTVLALSGVSDRVTFSGTTGGVDGDAMPVLNFAGKGGANVSGAAEQRVGVFTINTNGPTANNRGGSFAVVLKQDNSDSLLTRFNISYQGHVTPGVDNAQTMGSAPARWSVVYAGTGSINTSDARDKTDVAPLTDVELAAAADLARAIGTYQWLASIADKGTNKARHHAGLTVQGAISIMRAHGLDPMRYGFICYDEWDARPATADPETGKETDAARAAGDRYSFRPDELNLFLARGFAARLDALEAKAA